MQVRETTASKRLALRALTLAAGAVLAGMTSSASAAIWNDPAALGNTINTPLSSNPAVVIFTTTSPILNAVDGTPVKVGAAAVSGLTQDTYYYITGQGATPTNLTSFRLTNTPGGPALNGNFVVASGAINQVVQWHDAANWTGGAPNAVGANASFSTASASSSSQVVIDRNTTVGTIDFNGTSATGMSVISTTRFNHGPTGVLTFATPAGSPGPKITVTNTTGTPGQSFSLSESRYVANANSANVNGARLVIAGNQGLTIENNNPIQAIATVAGPLPASSSTAGAFRIGGLTDWSRFSGDLVLSKGAFAAQVPNNAAAGNTSLPMNNRIVLGSGTDAAQLEMPGNNGLIHVRGLDGNSASSVINMSTGSGPAVTLGSFSRPADSFSFAGNMGHPIGGYTTSTVPYNLRLVKMGPSTQELLGDNTFFNTTMSAIIHGGTLSLGSTGTIGVRSSTNPLSATAHGAVTGTYPALTGSSATNFMLRNGELKLLGNTAGDRIQAINGVLMFRQQNFTGGDQNNANNNYGYSTITLDASAAGSGAVQFNATSLGNRAVGTGAASNSNGSTVLFRGTNLGANPGAGVANVIFSTTPTNAAVGFLVSVGGTGALNSPTAPVLRGALADTSATGNGEGFATYGGSNGVRPLNQTTEVVLNAYPAANDGINHRLNLAGPTAIAGVVTNTLHVDNTSGSPQTLTSSGTAFNPKNGLLFSGNSAITLAGAAAGDALTGSAVTDSEDVIFHNTNTRGVTIAIAVSNPGSVTTTGNAGRQGWITYSGSGDYIITGTQHIGTGGGLALSTNGTTRLQGDITAANNSVHQFAISRGNVILDTGFRSGTTIAATNPNLNLVVAGGASLDLNGIQTQFDALSTNSLTNQAGGDNFGVGLITNSSTTNVDLILAGVNNAAGTSGASAIFPGVISGNVNLVVAKTAGSQRFANASTYTGSTTIRAGSTLILTRYGNLPSTTDLTLGDATTGGTLILGDVGGTNGAVNQTVASLNSTFNASQVNGQNGNVSVLTVNNASANSYTGSLVGNLALRKTNSGSLTLNAGAVANTYIGGTFIEGGEVIVAADARLGAVGAYLGSGATIANVPTTPVTSQANNVVLNGGTLHTTAAFTLTTGRGIGVGPIDGTVGGTGGINVDAGTALTYGGVIANAGNTGSNTLNKTGGGTLLLYGASTMTGTINVIGGFLGGSGSVVAAVNIGAGAVLAPGTSPGTFTISNSLSFDPASSLYYELVGNDTTVGGGVNDLTTGVTNLTLDGTLDVAASLSFLSAGIGDKWRLIDYSGSLTDNVLSLGSMPTLSAGLFFYVDTSTAGQVNLAVLPEPTSLLAIGAVAGLALRRRR